MAAITWRNVDAPDFSSSARMLGQAGDSFNNMFGVLNKQLEKHQAIGEQNWQNTANNNTDAFMGEMRKRYTTPEAYAAAQASGEVDALREQYGAQINVPAARELMYKMPENLQRQAVTQQAFAENRLHEKFKGTIAQALTQTMNGQGKEARTMLAESGMPPELQARTLADILTTEQQGLRSTQQTEAHNALMASRKSEDAYRASQVEAARVGKRPSISEIKDVIETQSGPHEAALKASIFGGPKVTDPKEQASIAALVTTLGTRMGVTEPTVFVGHVLDKLKGDKVLNSAGNIEYKIGDKTLQVPLPASLVTTAIQQDNAFMKSPATGTTAERLKALIQSPDFIDQAIAYENSRLNLATINREGSVSMSGGTPVRPAGYDDKDPSGFAATMREYRTRQVDAEAESERKVKQAQKTYSDPKTRQAAPFSFGF